jgi:hypothetical protein
VGLDEVQLGDDPTPAARDCSHHLEPVVQVRNALINKRLPTRDLTGASPARYDGTSEMKFVVWRFNIFETASNLAEPPKSGAVSAWTNGIVVALILILCGAYFSITGHGWFFNIGFKGVPRGQEGMFREVFGRQATALGMVLIGLGMFANAHWFRTHLERLDQYAEIAKVVSLAAAIASAIWWIIESI